MARALAAWLNRTSDPSTLEDHQHRRRSITRRTEPDGMTVYTCRLPPLPAGHLDAALTTRIMRSKPQPTDQEARPTLAQQHADPLTELLQHGTGPTITEIVLHVPGRRHKPATPSPPNSNSAAPPATAAATPSRMAQEREWARFWLYRR